MKVLALAPSYLGVTEHPPGSNSGPMVNKFLASCGLGPGAPWCMAFVHYLYKQFGVDLGGGASVGNFQSWAASKGEIVARPFKGDIVCYDWNGDRWPDHVAIVTKVLALRWRGKTFAGFVRTIEGNTSVGNDSDGGMVMYRYRWIKSAKFVRIREVLPYKV